MKVNRKVNLRGRTSKEQEKYLGKTEDLREAEVWSSAERKNYENVKCNLNVSSYFKGLRIKFRIQTNSYIFQNTNFDYRYTEYTLITLLSSINLKEITTKTNALNEHMRS